MSIHGSLVTAERGTTTCARCGYGGPLVDGLCASCTATPAKEYVAYTRDGKKLWCRPWQGEFDDQDRPVKDGELYLPGDRLCGHSDCVSKAHIVQADALAMVS